MYVKNKHIETRYVFASQIVRNKKGNYVQCWQGYKETDTILSLELISLG